MDQYQAEGVRQLIAKNRQEARAEMLQAAIEAVKAEKLEDPSSHDNDGDIAYDLAVDHCVRALERLVVE